MRQYGLKKTKTRVKGHQNCSICHPDNESRRTKRARQEFKAVVKKSQGMYNARSRTEATNKR